MSTHSLGSDLPLRVPFCRPLLMGDFLLTGQGSRLVGLYGKPHDHQVALSTVWIHQLELKLLVWVCQLCHYLLWMQGPMISAGECHSWLCLWVLVGLLILDWDTTEFNTFPLFLVVDWTRKQVSFKLPSSPTKHSKYFSKNWPWYCRFVGDVGLCKIRRISKLLKYFSHL